VPDRNERLNTLSRVITGYFQDAAEAKSVREPVLRRAYRETDPSYVAPSVPHPKIKTPYLFAVLNTKLSFLQQALTANGRYVHLEPVAPEYADVAPTITHAVDFQFRNRAAQNPENLETGFAEGFRYGDNYWIGKWFEHVSTGASGVKYEPLNINDVYPDPWAGRFYILRRFVTLQQLFSEAEARSHFDGGVAARAFKKVEKAVRDQNTSFTKRYGWHWAGFHENSFPSEFGRIGGDDSHGSSNTMPQDDPANVRITLLEYHETDPDGIVATIIPDFPNQQNPDHLFFAEPTPHPYKRCQVVRWAPYPVGKEAYAYSLYEIVGGLSKLNSFSLRASARRIQRYADPAVLHRKRAKINPVFLRSQSNVAIPVGEPDDVQYMDPPAGGDMHQVLAALTKNTMDMGLGESEQRRGRAGGADSATEAALAAQAGNSGDALIAMRAFRVIEDLADLTLRIMRVHVQRDTLIPILGERTAQANTILTPGILEHEYWVRAAGSTQGGMAPEARNRELMAMFAQFAQTGLFDPKAVADQLLTTMGFTSPDRFYIQKSAPLPVPPEMEHRQLLEAQDIRVSPQDDHQAHLQAHQTELLLIQQGVQPEPLPGYAGKLERHIFEHTNMLLQAQAAGEGVSPQQVQTDPFTAAQAGQPGQPAAFTSATSDINQQRQAPNEGRAPQPGFAPGREGVVLANGQGL